MVNIFPEKMQLNGKIIWGIIVWSKNTLFTIVHLTKQNFASSYIWI